MEQAAREPLWPFLLGMRVQRIDGPRPDLFAFTLFAQGQKRVLVVSFGATRGAGLCEQRPQGDAASAFVQKLRKHGENARLSELWAILGESQRVRAIELALTRGGETTRLLCDFDPQQSAVVLLDQRRVALLSSYPQRRSSEPYEPAPTRGITLARDEAGLLAYGAKLLGASGDERLAQARKELCAALERKLRKVRRRVLAIEQDLARTAEVSRLRAMGNVLLCQPGEVTKGAERVVLADLEDPTLSHEIKLDPRKDVHANANALFERARRLERGAVIARTRLGQALTEQSELEATLARAQHAEDAELSTLATQHHTPQPAASRSSRARAKGPQAHVPYRIYDGPRGTLYVGKNAADNDALTLRVARPHDCFVHARGVSGSHVIVPRERGQELSPELLLDAAHLAAHFSAFRGESSVEVQHIERRYVRKPKGAAPGAVILDREKVLLLRVEPERLATLLATERQA